MASLPADRLSTDPPFTNVGLDVCGVQHHDHQQNSAKLVLAPALAYGYSAGLPQWTECGFAAITELQHKLAQNINIIVLSYSLCSLVSR